MSGYLVVPSTCLPTYLPAYLFTYLSIYQEFFLIIFLGLFLENGKGEKKRKKTKGKKTCVRSKFLLLRSVNLNHEKGEVSYPCYCGPNFESLEPWVLPG